MNFTTNQSRTQNPHGTHADFQVSTDSASHVTTVEWSVSLSSGWTTAIVAYDSQHATVGFGSPHPSHPQASVQRQQSPSFKLGNSEEDCLVVLRKSAHNGMSTGKSLGIYLNISEWKSSIRGTLNCIIEEKYQSARVCSFSLKELSISKDTYSAGLGWGFKDIYTDKLHFAMFRNPRTSPHHTNSFGQTVNPGYNYARINSDSNDLVMKLNISLDVDKTYLNSKYEYVVGGLSLLSDNLESLYKNGKFSDISLIVNGQPLRAHKAILSARSPVLAAMLDSDMSENRTNKIEINDLDMNVVKEMLCFMYTGQVGHLEEVAFGLLTAADKYGLDSLKVKCAASLAGHLSVQNVAQIFRLADLHSVDKLQKTAADYIKRNMGAVRKTEGWKLLKKSCPELVIDTFIEN